MRTRPLAGRAVPVIGQGTWLLENTERSAAIAALRYGLDLGLSHIDTAEMYGNGEVEEIVGQALTGRRHEAFLVAKVLPHNATKAGTIAACERSLERLNSDYLDLYLLHWPSASPLAETFAAFEQLVAQGKIRAFGVSNFDVAEMEEAWRLAGDRVACNQVGYHLQERTIEARLLPWCEERGVPVVGYSPFGQGRFPPPGTGGGALQEIAADHGVTRTQVALVFLVRRESLFAIPKAAQRAHLSDNAAAAELTLNAEELDRIDRAFALVDRKVLPFW